MMLPEPITAALPRSADYSADFTARVQGLAKRLEADLGVTLSHHSDMNYRAGQHLSHEAKYEPRQSSRRSKGKDTVEIRIYISSKGPLFAIYCIDVSWTLVKPTQINHPIPEDLLPSEISKQVEVCRSRLTHEGYTEVERSLFDVTAPGCTTELDDLPATVFQCLFAEII